ncbi:alpha/beta-hydrolase [Hyaloraphidium curvatum]|nr:alpha/beta-hydrolase [Hyaloraphidium curvatum]
MAVPREHVFKRVQTRGGGTVEIAMDVFVPKAASKEAPVPVIAWWHGGGLLQGTRKAIADHFLDVDGHGMAFVSVDYRLAPQTRLPEILADVSDALSFIHTRFPSLHPEIDTSRLAVSGSSAGGWIALLVALGLVPPYEGPKPAAIAALYPITDTTDPFFASPQPPPKAEVAKGAVEPFLDPEAPEVSYSEQDGPRAAMYAWMVQSGSLNSLLLDGTGLSPGEFSIPGRVAEAKGSELPPIYISHGDADIWVPFSQSVRAADALRAAGSGVDFEAFPGRDHRNDWFFPEDNVGLHRFLKEKLRVR